MRCSEARQYVQRLLDGEELGQAGVRLGVHLGRCPRCAGTYAELKQLDTLLRQCLRPEPAPASFSTMALDLTRMARERREKEGARPRRLVLWAAATVAAVGVAAVLTFVPSQPKPMAAQVSAGWTSLHVFAPDAEVSHVAAADERLPSGSLAWATGYEVGHKAGDRPVELRLAASGRLRLSSDAVISLGADRVTLFKGWVRTDLQGRQRAFTIQTYAGTIVSTDGILRVELTPGDANVTIVVGSGTAQVLRGHSGGPAKQWMQLEAGQSMQIRPQIPGREPRT